MSTRHGGFYKLRWIEGSTGNGLWPSPLPCRWRYSSPKLSIFRASRGSERSTLTSAFCLKVSCSRNALPRLIVYETLEIIFLTYIITYNSDQNSLFLLMMLLGVTETITGVEQITCYYWTGETKQTEYKENELNPEWNEVRHFGLAST